MEKELELKNPSNEIILTDKYKIVRLDTRNIVLMKLNEKVRRDTGAIYYDWDIEGYYGKLSEVLTSASRELLNDKLFENSINLDELKDKIDIYTKEIKEIISNIKIKL